MNINRTKAETRANPKLCPLEFLNQIESNVSPEFQREQNVAECSNEEYAENGSETSVSPPRLLQKVFDDMNSTETQHDKTPKSSRVIVNDTPVEYYGISIFERRRLGV